MSQDSPATMLRAARKKLGSRNASAAITEAAILLERELCDVVGKGWNDLDDEQREALRSRMPTEMRQSHVAKWALGQMGRLLNDEGSMLRAAVAAHTPGVTHLDNEQIHWVTDLRNDIAHGRKQDVDVNEATIFVDLVESVLRILGRVAPRGHTEPSLTEATSLLVEKIRGMGSSTGPSRLDVLGLTLDRAWSPLYTTFRAESLRWDSQRPVALTLLLLDPVWDRLSAIDPSWPGRSARSLSTLRAEAPDLVRCVPGLSVTVHVYRSWPAIHGFRIGDVTIASLLSARTSVGTFAATAPYVVTHANSPDPVEHLLHGRFDEGWHEATLNSQEAFRVGG